MAFDRPGLGSILTFSACRHHERRTQFARNSGAGEGQNEGVTLHERGISTIDWRDRAGAL
jgi:hypothetical protein